MLPQAANSFLPQQMPFQMIDTLIEAGPELTRTSFLIPVDNVLVDEEFFTEGGLIENMAQSAAAGTGYRFSSEGKTPPVGYIGAVKHLKIIQRPAAGTQIETHLKTLHQVGNAGIVGAEIFSNGVKIASCELTIFVND